MLQVIYLVLNEGQCTGACRPSLVVELDRAVAISMRDGPEAGVRLIDALLAPCELADYHLAHSALGGPVPTAGKNRQGPCLL